jgi:type IV fimbrial biogenesis protein FimT
VRQFFQGNRAFQNGNSEIFPKTPFIGSNIPSVIPFICSFYPFVRNRNKYSGFTLVELIVTLTIAGILLALVVPSFFTFLASNRLTTQANELMADLNMARSEAVKRANNAGVCASNGGTSCSGTWQNGWIVFVDGDNSRTWTSGDTVLRIHEPLAGNVAMNSSASIVVFNASGLLANDTGIGNYTLCNSRFGQSRTISITTTGRPSLSSGTC